METAQPTGSRALYYGFSPTHDTWFQKGTSWHVVNDELPKVMHDVDLGLPSPISLVTDNVFEGHAILIWSYSQDSAGDVVLLAYDPNEPNGDDVEIIFNIANPDQTISFDWGFVQQNAGNTDWRAFFRAAYTNDLLGAAAVAALGTRPEALGELQPLAPSWHAWETFGVPPFGVDLQSVYGTGYVEGLQLLDPLGTAPATSPAVCSWVRVVWTCSFKMT